MKTKHFRKSTLAGLVSLLIAGTASAQTIKGQVVNKKGETVANAEVSVVGHGQAVRTDENGFFTLDIDHKGDVEIHVAKTGYAHQNFDIDEVKNGSAPVSFTLTRSAIEVIDVTATPLHASIIESATPVSVLSGETLRRRQAATLGDTLENEVGIHTNFHAGVASTPIIRGLTGPRVQITQNGLDVSDASRVGPDHSVATEASTAEQIEVLRGPATLFYGSGAIGGVVNIVDNRVPRSTDFNGEVLAQYDTVNEQKLTSLNLNTGSDNIAVHLDGFWRESDNYDIPVAAEIGSDDPDRFVANSGEESSGFTFGSSYLLDNGFVGFSYGLLDREYGIPGHSHGHEDEHEDEHEGEDDHGHEDEESVFADLEQDRFQLISELNFEGGFISAINSRFAYTDYAHSEIEGGAVGTTFENDTLEGRVDFMHHDVNGWRGGISVHYKNSDFEAQGEEAFTPPSETEMFAIAVMEEKHFGDVLVQLGARVERVTIDANEVVLPHIDLHGHDDDEHHDEDDHHDEDEHHDEGEEHGEDEHHDEDEHEHEEEAQVFASNQSFTPVSLSAGAVWDFAPGYNVAISVSRSERAPSAAELFSFGPHIGTRTYEVGALFELAGDEDHPEFELAGGSVEMETSNNIDLTFRKYEGDLGIVLNAFYNRVDDYYFQSNTGFFAEDGHDHGEEDEHGHEDEHHDEDEMGHEDEHEDEHGHEGEDEHEHEGELPVYLFNRGDAILHGFEAQAFWQASDELKVTLYSDYVRARLANGGGDLPRTPPLRFGSRFNYVDEQLSMELAITRYQEQDRVDGFETPTDGYTLVDFSLSYLMTVDDIDMTFYLHGENLTDEEARVHTSFLKDVAPRPGRNIALGVRANF